MSSPLAGIRIIDLGQVYAAPYCTMQLACLGADVIKVEPPETGEPLRKLPGAVTATNYNFLMLNAGKRSITLNLKHPRGREILMSLLQDADVLVENYSGGVMEKLELDYARLKSRFPRLIYASAKGYGSDSRWAQMGAMDFTVQAAAGMTDVTGYPDRPGVRTPATFIDMGTGSHLATGILAALIDRGRTGCGQKVEVAMLDITVPAMTSLLAPVLEGRKVKRLGNRHWGVCPGNVYAAANGDVSIFCLTEAHWRSMARIIGREDLLSDPRYRDRSTRLKIADEVDAIITDWSRTRSREEVISLLAIDGIPCAPVRSVEEVASDPETASRGLLRDSEFPDKGAIKVLGSPLKLSASEDMMHSRPPLLGQHTIEVLGEVGISGDEIEKLRSEGVI
ncbi:MAG TPA: CoA transferase [Candidatus Binataceae bacterium]|nr:CoA transferase [Candidatus Binataceae bacterium]